MAQDSCRLESGEDFSSVSVVILSPNFSHGLVAKDYEKAGPGKLRWTFAGGTREGNESGRDCGLRELSEEFSIKPAKESDLVLIPYEVPIWTGPKKWFAGFHLMTKPLKTTGVIENGTEILGPPEWQSMDMLLALPPPGGKADSRRYLHFVHARGLLETLLFLKEKGFDKSNMNFRRIWEEFSDRIRKLQRNVNPNDDRV